MGKREASMFAAQLGSVDLDAPRAKRHKATASSPVAVKEETAATNGVDDEDARGDEVKEDPEVVREKGLQLWQAIKDAVNKDGRVLSTDFLRLPSKRQYPDYYNIIKRPIALDDIKRQLESGRYDSFEEVKLDLEQCFKNAKRYNMKESQIWKDAKHLHKFVIKEASRLTGVEDAGEGDDDANGADGSDVETGDKKKKTPNMTRLLKSRLQKLVDKTDDQGRVLSAEFMELPSKKQWPFYYKQIKRPQCFENIFKHLKRKEYVTAVDFANDVELVFSNALEFNQEHTPIWEDTIILRDYFRQLMSDLPPPYTIPAYASQDHSTKIKLKMPAATQHASAVTITQSAGVTATASPRLRIPPLASTSGTSAGPAQPQPQKPPASVAPTPGPSTLPSSSTISLPAQTLSVQPAPQQRVAASSPSDAIAPVQSQHAYTYTQQKSQYPTTSYQAAAMASTRTPTLPNTNNIHVNVPRVAPKALQVAHVPPVPPVIKTPQPPPPAKVPNEIPSILLAAKSPTPVAMQNRRRLRRVSVLTLPFGRRLDMDHKDGVKMWTIRLGQDEKSIRVSDVKFLPHNYEEGENSDDDEFKESEKEKEANNDKGAPLETEQHEEEEEELEETPPQEKQKRGRGRPRKKPKAGKVESSPRDKGKGKAQTLPPDEEVLFKWNGTVVRPLVDEKETWEVNLTFGMNVIEVGEKDGIIWRMYLERTVAV